MRCKSGFARFIQLACSRLYVERMYTNACLWMYTNFVKPRKSISVLIFSVFHVDFLFFFIIVFVVFD